MPSSRRAIAAAVVVWLLLPSGGSRCGARGRRARSRGAGPVAGHSATLGAPATRAIAPTPFSESEPVEGADRAAALSLEIEVITPEGGPAANARLALVREEKLLGVGTTNAAGVAALQAGEGEAQLSVVSEGAGIQRTTVSIEPGRRRVKLPPGAAITGRIEIRGPPPLEPIEIQAFLYSGSEGSDVEKKAFRDLIRPRLKQSPGGNFELRGLEPGSVWTVHCWHPVGFRVDDVDGTPVVHAELTLVDPGALSKRVIRFDPAPTEDLDLGEVEIPAVRTLEYLVTDPAGAPIEGAYARLRPYVDPSTRTDAQGRGRIEIGPEYSRVIFGALRFAVVEVPIPKDGPDPLRVVLEPTAGLEVRIVSTEGPVHKSVRLRLESEVEARPTEPIDEQQQNQIAILQGTRLGTFNILNFSKKQVDVITNDQLTEDYLIGAVSLPMWFPPVVINGQTFIDAVYITDANVEEAIRRGADEIWAIWTVSTRDEWRPGFVSQYFHIIEAVADTHFFGTWSRIEKNNAAIAAGGPVNSAGASS